MARRWEDRAFIGATLVAVVIPLAGLTGSALGLHLPAPLLVAFFVIELIVVTFAVALVVLPHRAWRLGRRASDVRYSLHMPRVVAAYAPEPSNPAKARASFSPHLHNSGSTAVKYHVEVFEVQLDGKPPTDPVFNTLGGIVVPGGDDGFACPAIRDLDSSLSHHEGLLRWVALVGPADGKFEVRWSQEVVIELNRGVEGQPWAFHQLNKTPVAYEVIKPTAGPTR